jgi:hypothetical protein
LYLVARCILPSQIADSIYSSINMEALSLD